MSRSFNTNYTSKRRIWYDNLYHMENVPQNSFPKESLPPDELQIAREQNDAMLEGPLTARILIVEEVEERPSHLSISYGGLGVGLPLTAKGKVKPGDRIVVDFKPRSGEETIAGFYVLGENLIKRSQQSPAEPNA
jgi:hypothetical protein